jgi:uncharacterized protein YeaO (DUF488 family)
MKAAARTGARTRARTRAKRKPRSKRLRSLIAIKRAYEKPAAQDGLRILIDRLWPRGLSKAKLKLDAWPRELSPSTALRRWYAHKPERFAEFRRRYSAELAHNRDGLDELRAMIKGRTATLLTATHDLELSHAEVLRRILQRKK